MTHETYTIINLFLLLLVLALGVATLLVSLWDSLEIRYRGRQNNAGSEADAELREHFKTMHRPNKAPNKAPVNANP